MKAVFPFLVFLFSFSFFSFSQGGRPYAIWDDSGAGLYRFVKLDATTGTKTNLSVIPGMQGFVAGNVTAYDAAHDWYHFEALMTGGFYRFYTLDAGTGNIVYDPVINVTLYGLNYNCSDSTLYALRDSSGFYTIVRVDPVTASTSTVVTFSGINAYVTGSASFNSVTGRYTCKLLNGGSYYLKTCDVNTGMIVTNPFPDNVTGMRYSCFDNATYGLWDDGSGGYKLEKVTVTTGIHTTVATLAGVDPGYVSESHSVDDLGKYTFRGFNTSGQWALFSVDLSTGAVVASSLTGTEHAIGFEEMNCCAVVPTGIENLSSGDVNVFPVPANDKLNIQLDEESEITVCSITGQKIFNKKGAALEVDCSEWSSGMYIIKIGKGNNLTFRKIPVIH